ncbi:hypothetical protein AUJ65_02125 [Candidatus Micrarchaeota archaeon CG1_02_51_15]|nr:MAG: hypothetical protein AUJ65_02125 [Candidatus Micrarchaeota archaeon CG1_02_51_15]
MTEKPRVLFLGSKEFPYGANNGQDPIKSGGIETAVQTLANALASRTRLTIVTRDFQQPNSTNGVTIKKVPWLKGEFLRNPSFNASSFTAALTQPCDLIHCHGLVAGLFGLIAGRLRNKPIVVTPHGIASGQPQYPAPLNAFLLALERLVYSRANATIFLSQGEKQRFANKSVFAKNPVIIPLGIPLERFERRANSFAASSFRQKNAVPQNATVITFVGRLVKVKACDVLLKAFKKTRDKNTILLIVGDGPERTALEKQAYELDLGGRVRFLGHRSDLPAIMAATDVFVLPSHSEGLPSSMLEAMASHCACIVTDIGLPVENEVDVLVVKPGDAAALARAITKLAKRPRLREQLARKAFQKTVKTYGIQTTARQHLQLYYSLLNRKPNR